MVKITAGLEGQPIKFIEVPTKAVVLVPSGISPISVLVVEHLAKVRAFLFDGNNMTEVEELVGETFEEAVTMLKTDLEKAVLNAKK